MLQEALFFKTLKYCFEKTYRSGKIKNQSELIRDASKNPDRNTFYHLIKTVKKGDRHLAQICEGKGLTVM